MEQYIKKPEIEPCAHENIVYDKGLFQSWEKKEFLISGIGTTGWPYGKR